MKSKTAISIMLFAMFCLSQALPGSVPSTHALFDSDVKKAKEFMAAGMYPQAIELLNKRINDKPTDAEAHFELGICYVNTGNYGRADERFGSAVRLEPDYGYKIGGKYKKVGDEALISGGIENAQGLYQQAIKYQPNLEDQIVRETYSHGKKYFDSRHYDSADKVFMVAIAFNRSISQRVGNLYFELGQSSGDQQSIEPYRRAKKFSNSHNKEIGERFLNLSKGEIPDKDVKKWRAEAAKYIEVPPEYKIYPPGTYFFSLKAGEKTDQWIMFPYGRKNKYDLTAENYKFQLLYDDGTLINAWEADHLPKKTRVKFKIIAVSDQPKIKMVVK